MVHHERNFRNLWGFWNTSHSRGEPVGSVRQQLGVLRRKEYATGTEMQEYVLGFPRAEKIADFIKGTNLLDIDRDREKNKFQSAKTIAFNADATHGIGDSIEAFHFAQITATKYPGKTFYIRMRPELAAVTYLNIPRNVTIVDDFSTLWDQSSVFYFNDDLFGVPQETASKIRTEHRVSEDSPFTMDYDQYAHHVFGIERVDDRLPVQFNQRDAYFATWLGSLGVEITSQDLAQPVLCLEKPQELPVYDLLIAPDAFERSNGHNMSTKSIPVVNWKEIFKTIRSQFPDIKIGIVRGVSHVDYCKEVYQAAKEAVEEVKGSIKQNDLVQEVVTKTFTELVVAINNSRIFCAMDSAPVHLGNEVALVNQQLQVREIFTADIPAFNYGVNQYGIRGIGERGRILGFRMKGRFTYDTDLHDAEEDIADFLTAGLKAS